MLKCVKITSFFFILLFELLPDTTSTVSGDCDFLRSCVNYKYREKKKENIFATLLHEMGARELTKGNTQLSRQNDFSLTSIKRMYWKTN